MKIGYFLPIVLILYPIFRPLNAFIPGSSSVGAILQLVLIIWIILLLTIKSPKIIIVSKTAKKIILLLVIFVLLTIYSLIRSYASDIIDMKQFLFTLLDLIFFFLAGLYANLYPRHNTKIKNRTNNAIYLGLIFYVSLNFLLYILGIKDPNLSIEEQDRGIGVGLIAQVLGFESNRILFPLASGFGATHFGALAGVPLVAAFLNLIYSPIKYSYFYKLVSVIIIIICLCTVILTDTRAAFFSFIMITLIFTLIRIKVFIGAKIINLLPLIFIGSYFIVFIGTSISVYLEPFFREIGLLRGSSYTFSQREIIWYAVIQKLSDFSPTHLIGYGMWGQYISGVYSDYDYILQFLQNKDNTAYFTLHSTILQNIFDIGYFGLAIYLILTFLSMKSLINLIKFNWRNKTHKDIYPIVNLAVLCYLIILGSFDAVLTQERIYSLGIYILIVTFSLQTRSLK